MKEKKGENCPSSKKRGFDPGALVGGGEGDDDTKKTDPKVKCTK